MSTTPNPMTTPKAMRMGNLPLPAEVRTDEVFRAMLGRGPLSEIRHEHVSLSPNEIVPEATQMRLMALEDTLSRSYFEIGDIAAILIRYAPQVTRDKLKIVTEQDVFDAVGYFCHRSGRTVRYYTETAVFYPEAVRSEFDMLPFGHFVCARAFPSRWRDVLEYARDNPSIGEDRLREQFITQFDPMFEEKQEFYSEHPGIEDVIAQEMRDYQPDKDDPLNIQGVIQPRRSNSLLLSRLSSLVDNLERVLNRVDEPRRERVRMILAEVRELILDVQKDVSAYGIM